MAFGLPEKVSNSENWESGLRMIGKLAYVDHVPNLLRTLAGDPIQIEKASPKPRMLLVRAEQTSEMHCSLVMMIVNHRRISTSRNGKQKMC